MTDEIKPVLTSDEWTARCYRDGDMHVDADLLGGCVVVSAGGDAAYVATADASAAIALLNDLLPADSPYKITRDDVELVEYQAGRVPDGYRRMIALAAKLAALLPPE